MPSMGKAPVASVLASWMVSQARFKDSSSWEGLSQACSKSMVYERNAMKELEAAVYREDYPGVPYIYDKESEKGGDVLVKRGGKPREAGGKRDVKE